MIIEDDPDDQQLFKETFLTLDYPNEVIIISNGNDALSYLGKTHTPPVLIISDINMPKIDGFEVKKRINKNQDRQNQHIPFIFFSTSAQKRSVMDAYSVSDQGFFVKPHSMANLRDIIKTIVDYWLRCYTPAIYINAPERHFPKDKSHENFRCSING